MIGSPSSNSTVQRLVGRYGLRGIWWAKHPGPSILNFGRVHFPRSMGSRFTPLTEMDTVEDVPTTHANDAIQVTPVAEGLFELDTETGPSLGGDGSDVDGHSDGRHGTPHLGRGGRWFRRGFGIRSHACGVQHSRWSGFG